MISRFLCSHKSYIYFFYIILEVNIKKCVKIHPMTLFQRQICKEGFSRSFKLFRSLDKFFFSTPTCLRSHHCFSIKMKPWSSFRIFTFIGSSSWWSCLRFTHLLIHRLTGQVRKRYMWWIVTMYLLNTKPPRVIRLSNLLEWRTRPMRALPCLLSRINAELFWIMNTIGRALPEIIGVTMKKKDNPRVMCVF